MLVALLYIDCCILHFTYGFDSSHFVEFTRKTGRGSDSPRYEGQLIIRRSPVDPSSQRPRIPMVYIIIPLTADGGASNG